MRLSLKRLAVIGVTTGAIIGGGAAWAYWNTSGDGQATGQAGTAQSLTSVSGTIEGNLFPNALPHDLVLTVTNPNPYRVHISKITLTAAAGATTPATCTGFTGAFDTGLRPVTPTVGDPLSFDVNLTVDQAAGPQVLSAVTGAVKMLEESAPGCAGQPMNVTFSLS